ncbi:MAG: hypothetical protein ACE5FD_05960 [Anaerolineae bacterium]
MPETTIASFILRFVQDHDAAQTPGEKWHGVIRHVQTSEETRFTDITEALAFMAGYVQFDYQNSKMEGSG